MRNESLPVKLPLTGKSHPVCAHYYQTVM